LPGGVLGQGRGELGAGPLQPRLTRLRQLLAAFPQRQRLLEGQPARLQAAHHRRQLLAGLLVAQLRLGRRVLARRHASSSSSRSLAIATSPSSANRNRSSSPGATSEADRTTVPSARRTIAYPRARVVAGDSACS